MIHKIVIIANGAFALGFLLLGVYGSIVSDNMGGRQSAVLSVVAGFWIASIVIGLLFRRRVLVLLLSIPVIGFALLFAFILLFAPLAWGNSNLATAYGLQVVALGLILIQIAGILAVFSKRPSGDDRAHPRPELGSKASPAF